MGPLVWGVVAVAAVCLLQLPLTHWLARYFEQDRGGGDPATDLPATAEAYDRGPGVCPLCGTHNGEAFEYCANCLAPLSRPGR